MDEQKIETNFEHVDISIMDEQKIEINFEHVEKKCFVRRHTRRCEKIYSNGENKWKKYWYQQGIWKERRM